MNTAMWLPFTLPLQGRGQPTLTTKPGRGSHDPRPISYTLFVTRHSSFVIRHSSFVIPFSPPPPCLRVSCSVSLYSPTGPLHPYHRSYPLIIVGEARP